MLLFETCVTVYYTSVATCCHALPPVARHCHLLPRVATRCHLLLDVSRRRTLCTQSWLRTITLPLASPSWPDGPTCVFQPLPKPERWPLTLQRMSECEQLVHAVWEHVTKRLKQAKEYYLLYDLKDTCYETGLRELDRVKQTVVSKRGKKQSLVKSLIKVSARTVFDHTCHLNINGISIGQQIFIVTKFVFVTYG